MTFGAPPGALGAPNGPQSGSESRMSMLIVPLNDALIRVSDPWGARASPGRVDATRSDRRSCRASPPADHPCGTGVPPLVVAVLVAVPEAGPVVVPVVGPTVVVGVAGVVVFAGTVTVVAGVTVVVTVL